MLFDTHTHLNDDKLFSQAEQYISQAKAAGVLRVADIGCDRPSSVRSLELAARFPDFVSAVVGYHPYDADKVDDAACEELLEWGKRADVVAIGEIGLDYYRDINPKKVQYEAFIRQLEVAQMLKTPVVIHDRDAHGDIMDILRAHRGGLYGGIIHCFSGSKEMARICLDMGFDIAFGGALTFQNARNLLEVCAYVPMENMLTETDCPYLTPHPHRGKTNEPAFVAYVAERIASIKGLPFDEVAQITYANALRVYGLNK
ncbi:MAG: TatD family hydrolase [Firmicutes bacterium]|nr:TatD family hydrolase [Bacillota bacterium]